MQNGAEFYDNLYPYPDLPPAKIVPDIFVVVGIFKTLWLKYGSMPKTCLLGAPDVVWKFVGAEAFGLFVCLSFGPG